MNPGVFEDDDTKGICQIGVEFSDGLGNRSFQATFFLTTCILDALPVVAFLLLNDPHDCFRCFGKDPDRTYSSFQLNLRERTYRGHKQKYGKKVASRINRMSTEVMTKNNESTRQTFNESQLEFIGMLPLLDSNQ